jgi:hypothetical protein
MASLELIFNLTDGTKLPITAPMSDADVARFVAWGVADASRLPTEMDDTGEPLPRTVSWMLRRLTEMFLSETFAKVAAYEHDAALAAIKPPTAIPVNLG